MTKQRHLMCGSLHKDSSSPGHKVWDSRPAIRPPLVPRFRAITQKFYEENKAKDVKKKGVILHCMRERANVGPVPVAAPLAVAARGARLSSAPTTNRILRQDLLAPVNCKGRLPLLPETQPPFPSFLAHACTTNRRTWYVMDFAWRDIVCCCCSCYSL